MTTAIEQTQVTLADLETQDDRLRFIAMEGWDEYHRVVVEGLSVATKPEDPPEKVEEMRAEEKLKTYALLKDDPVKKFEFIRKYGSDVFMDLVHTHNDSRGNIR